MKHETKAVSVVGLLMLGAVLLLQPQLLKAAVGYFTDSGSFNNSTMSFAADGRLNSCDPTSIYQSQQGSNYAAYGVHGCVTIPSNSTNHEGGGVLGLATNASTTTNAVGGSLYCIVQANGIDGTTDANRVRCWGLNSLVADYSYSHTLLMNELDYNVTGTDTKVVGFFSSGVSTQQLAAGSIWMNAGPVGSGVPWPIAYGCADGGATICVQVGPTGTSANSNSQITRFISRDSNNAINTADLSLGSGGGFFVNLSAAGGAVRFRHNGTDAMVINSDGGVNPKGVTYANLGAQGNGTMQYCSDCNAGSNPCTITGTGAIAKRLNGAWDCR